MGLGSLLKVGLSEAREKAADARKLLGDQIDPLERKVVPTFGVLAEELLDQLEGAWRNEKHRKQWRSTLKTHAKGLSDKKVDQITTEDVLDVLKPIWAKTPETASRLRGRIEHVMSAAKAKG